MAILKVTTRIGVRGTAKSVAMPNWALPNCRPWHCQFCGTAKFGSAKLPSEALPNPWNCQISHCQTAVRGTAKCVALPNLTLPNRGNANSVALPNLALPNCRPRHCQIRGTAKFRNAKRPSVALPNAWHCQT